MAQKIVVDSSVLVKWIKTRDEEFIDEARNLLAEIERRRMEVHVPALLLYEIGNILLLKTQLDGNGFDDAIHQLESLPMTIAPPATPLLRRAARLGRDYSLTFYDASFVALAVELDCAFVTADRRLFDRTRALTRVRHISRIGAL